MSTSRSCSGSSWRSEIARRSAPGLLLAATLLVGGCGLIPEEWLAEDEYFVEALPDTERTRIQPPRGTRDVGDPAISVEVMEQVSSTLNGLTFDALGIIDVVVTHAPDTYERDLRTWGPRHTELYGLSYTLHVERDPPDRFAYQFHAAPGEVDDPALRTMWGQYRRDGDGVGTGAFVLDLDAVATLANDDGFGGWVGVVHDIDDDGSVEIGMDLRDAELPVTDSVVMNGPYVFRSDALGGEFCYDARYPLLDESTWEELHAYARWDATGAGRAAARITGGELGGDTMDIIECWDADGETVYWWDDTGFEDGDPALCIDDDDSLPDCLDIYPNQP